MICHEKLLVAHFLSTNISYTPLPYPQNGFTARLLRTNHKPY